MAPSKSKKAVSKKPREEETDDRDDRNGEQASGEGDWEDVTPDRTPWIVKEPGLVVTGILLGRHSYGSGRERRYFYQIKLTGKGTLACVSGSGDDQESVECGRGDVVSIGESFALERDLAPLTDDGGRYEIKLVIGEPERDGKGKPKFWPFKVSKRTLKAPTRAPRIQTKPREDRDERDRDESDDVPF